MQASAGDWTFERVTHSERQETEAFIAASFLRAYGARLTRFFPVLMALRHRTTLLAACGLRRAAWEPLFLEAYLDARVEDALASASHEPVERAAIVEVGNLAVARPGIARRLILELTRHLQRAGLAWSVFSAVPALRNNFVRLNIPLVVLAPAAGHRLGRWERMNWGSYYDSAPQVTAVRVAAAHAALGAACTR